jgi:hypothetical protein
MFILPLIIPVLQPRSPGGAEVFAKSALAEQTTPAAVALEDQAASASSALVARVRVKRNEKWGISHELTNNHWGYVT